MRNNGFLKNWLFPKSNSSKKVDAAQNYLVRKSTSFENVFILNSFSNKKVGVPKSTYLKELPILKNLFVNEGTTLKSSEGTIQGVPTAMAIYANSVIPMILMSIKAFLINL